MYDEIAQHCLQVEGVLETAVLLSQRLDTTSPRSLLDKDNDASTSAQQVCRVRCTIMMHQEIERTGDFFTPKGDLFTPKSLSVVA